MTRNRQLAKLLAPALLLSATLALPAPSAGVSFISGSKATVSKVEVEKEKPKKVKVKKVTTKKAAPQKAAPQKVVTRKVTVKAARPAAQTIVVRPAAPRTVYVQPTRAAVPYRPSAGENSPLFAVAGVLTDEGRHCLALRDRNGKLYTLVGKTEGLEIGDDVELMVRRVLPVYARECSQGDTVRVGQVRTIWSDESRRSAIYDSRYDGTFDPYQRDRYERDDNYDDRYGYDDRYDRNDRYGGDDRYYDDNYGRDYRDENGRLISVTGRLGGTASCATLRDRDGRLFGLSGDLRNYDPGDTVRVIGFLQGGNRCGGPNIDVQEVRGQ